MLLEQIFEITDTWRIPHENRTCQTLTFLAIKTTQGCSTPITYILFPTKMQKGKRKSFLILRIPRTYFS
jgi:hypothetical protein